MLWQLLNRWAKPEFELSCCYIRLSDVMTLSPLPASKCEIAGAFSRSLKSGSANSRYNFHCTSSFTSTNDISASLMVQRYAKDSRTSGQNATL